MGFQLALRTIGYHVLAGNPRICRYFRRTVHVIEPQKKPERCSDQLRTEVQALPVVDQTFGKVRHRNDDINRSPRDVIPSRPHLINRSNASAVAGSDWDDQWEWKSKQK